MWPVASKFHAQPTAAPAYPLLGRPFQQPRMFHNRQNPDFELQIGCTQIEQRALSAAPKSVRASPYGFPWLDDPTWPPK